MALHKDGRFPGIPGGGEGINLPSYGLNLLDEGKARDMLNIIRNDQMLKPEASNSQSSEDLVVYIENSDENSQNADNTGQMVTLQTSDIKEDDVDLKVPELTVEIKQQYSRFRYTSEKQSKKKQKISSCLFDDDLGEEKKDLAEIKLKNYTGVAKIVSLCSTKEGDVHPYNLYGENCNNGVFVLKNKFREGRTTLRMKKVSITTPREKEYKENQKRQRAYLSEVGINGLKFYNEVKDKQIVYIRVIAILEDRNNEVISVISKPLLNKKKGEEFKIDDIEPCSAPACGYTNNNVTKNRIMLHVTEKTACPTKLGVKIRERDSSGMIIWEHDLHDKDVTVVKQCVVKFVPPPYRDPKVEKDVNVEVCLYDCDIQIETDPVTIVYRGSENCDLCYSGHQSKKRRLDQMSQDDYMSYANAKFDPEDNSSESRRLLRTISKELPEESMAVEAILVQGQQGACNSAQTSSFGTQEVKYSHPMYQIANTSQETVALQEEGGDIAEYPLSSQAEQTIAIQPLSDVSSSQASMPGPSNAMAGNQQTNIPPNFSIAVIEGVVHLVYHDDNTPSQSVQNIGDQQVFVQSIPPQQPSDDMEQSNINSNTGRYDEALDRSQQIQDGENATQSTVHQNQQQQLQQQQQNQKVLLQILQHLIELPSQEARNQWIQSILRDNPSLLPVIQHLNQTFFPNNDSSSQGSVVNEEVSEDLNDDDLEIDGAHGNDVIDNDNQIYSPSMIPTCVEEVTVKTEHR